MFLSKPPALRILFLGPRGSGKTTHGKWLAQKLGLFHIQFREQLQTLIMFKTKKRVPCSDEVESSKEAGEDLEARIKEAMGEEEGMKNTSNRWTVMEVSFQKHFILHCFLLYIFDIADFPICSCVYTGRSGTK